MGVRFLLWVLLVGFWAGPVPGADPAPAPASTPALGQEPPPTIFLDKPPQIVAYQLRRLTNDQLIALERKDDDPKYKPIYEALLSRKALVKDFRLEAVEALAKLNGSNPVAEWLASIGRAADQDRSTARELTSIMLAQHREVLADQRPMLQRVSAESDQPMVRRAAFGALVVILGDPAGAWSRALRAQGGLPLLLDVIPDIPDPALRQLFFPLVLPLAQQADRGPTRLGAIEALGFIPGHDEEIFRLMAGLLQESRPEERAAAVRALRRTRSAGWPKEQVEPVAKSLLKLLASIPPQERADPAAIEILQLGDDLASVLAPAQGAPIRKGLRDLGLRVVLIRTLREQMQYDICYFAVQAGKPIRIVLENADFMPHNLVVIAPGALLEVALEAAAMPLPADPQVKPYVPGNEKVLHATGLIQTDQSVSLDFRAPAQPGEYPFACTFPGHFARMYGVMIVVADLEAWDSNPTIPTDPLTNQPFESSRHEPSTAPMAGHGHE